MEQASDCDFLAAIEVLPFVSQIPWQEFAFASASENLGVHIRMSFLRLRCQTDNRQTLEGKVTTGVNLICEMLSTLLSKTGWVMLATFMHASKAFNPMHAQ